MNGGTGQEGAAMQDEGPADVGALVGWTAERSGGRVTLRLQTVTRPPPHAPGDVRSTYVVMDRNQAVQLGNFLFDMVEQQRPLREKRGWLARLFGG